MPVMPLMPVMPVMPVMPRMPLRRSMPGMPVMPAMPVMPVMPVMPRPHNVFGAHPGIPIARSLPENTNTAGVWCPPKKYQLLGLFLNIRIMRVFGFSPFGNTKCLVCAGIYE